MTDTKKTKAKGTPKQLTKVTRKKSLPAEMYIPELQEKMLDVKKYLVANNSLGMILIDASKINKIEFFYGKSIYDEVLDVLKKVIFEMKGNQIRNKDIITINHKRGDHFYIFLSKKRETKSLISGDIEKMANRLNVHINEKIYQTINPLLKERLKISVGYAIIIYNPLIELERLIDKLVEEAKVMANYQEFRSNLRNKEKLQELIIKEEIRTIFHPIVDIKNNVIIGYEALTRGPAGTEYENPYVLFNVAEETGMLFELDRICRKHALINARGIEKKIKLFVNILPVTIQDPEFRGKYLKTFLKDIDITPHEVVLEVSERQAIENFNIFKEESKKYTDLGFAIAIDDAGTGYSNLKTLLELKLQYIKLDISLIRDIDKNVLKQEIVNSMVNIGKSINALVIAEGIETVEELKLLIKLGVDYGQGFLFARPSAPFPKIHKPKVG